MKPFKIAKKVLLLGVSIFILLPAINVGAVAETIELGTGKQAPQSIGTMKFTTSTTASDTHNLRHPTKSLVTGAEEARKKGYQKPMFPLTTSTKNMKLENNYYITEEIYAKTASNISSYNVAVARVKTTRIIDTARIGYAYKNGKKTR